MKLLVLMLVVIAAVSADRPNVVFIMCDDLNTELGCYGSVVPTPGIDALARRGVTFTRAFSQYPLCNPSRSSMITGLRPDRTRILSNGPLLKERLPGVMTMPLAFRRAGYHTVRIGKFDHPADAEDYPTGSKNALWDVIVLPRGIEQANQQRINRLDQEKGTSLLGWLALDAPDHAFTDGCAADIALAQIEVLKDRRFFLALGFVRPHTPWIAPKRYFDLTEQQDVHLDERIMPSTPPKNLPKAALGRHNPAHARMSDDDRRMMIRGYRACITYIDHQVQLVLDALDRLGLSDNTIVIFTSDHGFLLGEHGLWQKQFLFDRSLQVPLIMAGPGITAVGQRCAGPTELVDLFPTLASLCDLACPPGISGVDFSARLRDVTAPGRTTALSMVDDGRSLRSARWRYTEWDDGDDGIELYDHDQDPDELINLASDPTYAPVMREMRRALAAERGR